MEKTQDYKGFKLGEKKSLKAKEGVLAEATKTLNAKLGTGWEFSIDWEGFSKLDDKQWIAGNVYDKIVARISSEDVNGMDEDVVEALNDAVGENKRINLVLGEKGGEYPAGRYKLDGFDGGITVTWNPENMGYDYPYSSKYTITQYVLDNC